MSFESMESPELELHNLRNVFEDHRKELAAKDAEIERLKEENARLLGLWTQAAERIGTEPEEVVAIARLESDLEKLHGVSGGLLHDNHALLVVQLKDRKLIAELAEVVNSAQILMGWNSYDDLLHRAREAVK